MQARTALKMASWLYAALLVLTTTSIRGDNRTSSANATTSSANVTAATTVPPAPPVPVVYKCCPEGQVLSLRPSLECVPRPSNQHLYPIEPAFASRQGLSSETEAPSGRRRASFDEEEDEGESAPASQTVPFSIIYKKDKGLKECGVRQQRGYLIAPGNDVDNSAYLIDDVGLSENCAYEMPLLEIAEAEAHPDYCVDAAVDDGRFLGTAAAYCFTREEFICDERPCLTFCCAYDEVLKSSSLCSVASDRDAENPTFVMYKASDSTKVSNATQCQIRNFYESRPHCKSHSYDEFTLLDDGRALAGGAVHARGNFCVGILEEHLDDKVDDGTPKYLHKRRIITCKLDDPSSQGNLRYKKVFDLTIVPILFGVSLFFLAWLFVFVWRKSKAKLFGAMTLSLVAMLFCFYAIVIIPKVAGGGLVKTRGLCATIGFSIQFFYLSAIFWLNAMSLDIWLAFRRMRTTGRASAPSGGHSHWGFRHPRYKWYALYSWACPLVVVAVTILMNYLPDLPEGVIKPEVGEKSCFLLTTTARAVYLYVIVVPLASANIFFFAASTWNLCCGVWAAKHGDPVIREQNRTRYVTVIKMFFAMGITWISDAISDALFDANNNSAERGVVVFFTVINSLQGLILFVAVTLGEEKVRRAAEWIKAKATCSKVKDERARKMSSLTTVSGMQTTCTTPSPASSLCSRRAKAVRAEEAEAEAKAEAVEMHKVGGQAAENEASST